MRAPRFVRRWWRENPENHPVVVTLALVIALAVLILAANSVAGGR